LWNSVSRDGVIGSSTIANELGTNFETQASGWLNASSNRPVAL